MRPGMRCSRATGACGAGRYERAAPEGLGLRPRIRRAGLTQAGSRGGTTSTTAGLAACRGPQRAAPGVPGHLGARPAAALRLTGDRVIPDLLGRGTVLPPLQAELRPTPAAEPSRGDRGSSSGLVDGGPAGLGTARPRWSRPAMMAVPTLGVSVAGLLRAYQGAMQGVSKRSRAGRVAVGAAW